MYQFPFLAGVTFAGFIVPQAIGLTNYVLIPVGVSNRVMLMAVLCAAAIYLGYMWPKRPLKQADWSLDPERLTHAAFVLTVVGAAFLLLIGQLPEEMKRGNWTGLPVAYLFFARMSEYGFAIAVLVYASTRSRKALLVAGIGGVFYLQQILFAARRAQTAEFFIVIVLALWFTRRRSIPRWAMMLGLVGAMVLSTFNIGAVRSALNDGVNIAELRQIEWSKELNNTLSGEDEFITQAGGGELEAAAYYIDATEEAGAYNWGLDYWNFLVTELHPCAGRR